MTRRQLMADQAFTLLKRESQNTHVKLRTIAQTVIQTGDLPGGTENGMGAHCLTPPAAMPDCQWRCRNMKAMISGNTARSEPVITSG